MKEIKQGDTMKEIVIDGVEYTLTPKKKFNYPLWFKSKRLKHIVKFDSLECGTIVIASFNYKIGHYSSEWVPHTDEDIWEQVEDPYELNDKDAVWCWDNDDKCIRSIKFWDAESESTFCHNGQRNGAFYNNYEKIQSDDEHVWIKEARKLLED